MEYRPLGGTGTEVSAIGLGCVTFGREIDERASADVLDRALSAGINLLDTADSYANGESERVLGRLLRRSLPRQRVFVCSKVGGSLEPANIARAAETSLGRLGLDAIDCYLLHNFDRERPLKPALEALHRLVEQGKVRHIGCSNFSRDQIEEALRIQAARGWTKFAVVQPMYNLVARHFESALLPLCLQRQIGVVTYSPLGAGFLTGKYVPGSPLPVGARFDLKPGHCRHYFHSRSFAFLGTLQAVAARANASPIHLALAWVLAQPGVSTMLIGARLPRHIDQATDAWAKRQNLAHYLAELTDHSREFTNSLNVPESAPAPAKARASGLF